MKNKPDIKALKRYLESNEYGKVDIIQHLKLSTTDAVDKWISRGRLPVERRRQILKFIRI